MKYSITCFTHRSKHEWLLNAQELLRQEFLIMGEWFRQGITETKYHTLRAKVQIDFPYYTGKLSKLDWERYQGDRFDPRQNKIGSAIAQMRQKMFDSKTYSPNLDDDIN